MLKIMMGEDHKMTEGLAGTGAYVDELQGSVLLH